MKLKLHPHRKHLGMIEAGPGVVILVLLLFLIFLGFLIYIYVKLAPRIKPRKLPDEQINQVEQPRTSPDVQTFEFSYQAPGITQIAQANDPGEWMALVQRSTNLMDWADLYVTPLADELTVEDEDPPWPCGFYRCLIFKR